MKAVIQNALVEVIVDPREKRLRVRPLRPMGITGWVRFSLALREENAIYFVGRLTELPGGSWNPGGEIRRVI